MQIYYDGDAAAYAGHEVDIGMAFALNVGYRAPASSFGVLGSPGSDEYTAGLLKLYNHGVQWGKLDRVAASGKTVPWRLPTEGRWPTVSECRARYASRPPNTSWMDTPPSLAIYLTSTESPLP